MDLDALAEALLCLATMRDLRTTLGRAAKVKASAEFAWPSVLRKYEALWQQQLSLASSTSLSNDDKYPAVSNVSATVSHYPTHAISMSSYLVTRRKSSQLLELLHDGSLFQTNDADFESSVDEDILKSVTRADRITIRDLVGQPQYAHLEVTLLISHICRLIKNGLLRTSPSVIEHSNAI